MMVWNGTTEQIDQWFDDVFDRKSKTKRTGTAELIIEDIEG